MLEKEDPTPIMIAGSIPIQTDTLGHESREEAIYQRAAETTAATHAPDNAFFFQKCLLDF